MILHLNLHLPRLPFLPLPFRISTVYRFLEAFHIFVVAFLPVIFL